MKVVGVFVRFRAPLHASYWTSHAFVALKSSNCIVNTIRSKIAQYFKETMMILVQKNSN
jgi:hypothetical protein